MGREQKAHAPSAVGTFDGAGAKASAAKVAAEFEVPRTRMAKFRIGEVVRHKHFPFRGVVFDVDPVFDNTEEWYQSIPEDIRPDKDQPFYHLFAENADSEYVAYVSEQNLEHDPSDEPVRHPRVTEALLDDGEGGWRVLPHLVN